MYKDKKHFITHEKKINIIHDSPILLLNRDKYIRLCSTDVLTKGENVKINMKHGHEQFNGILRIKLQIILHKKHEKKLQTEMI